MADHRRRDCLLDFDDVGQWNHATAIGAHVKLAHIVRRHTPLGVGLCIHTIGAIIEVKIVYIHRRHVYLKRIGNLSEGDSEALSFLAVDAHKKLRIGCAIAGEQSRETTLRVPTSADQLVGDLF